MRKFLVIFFVLLAQVLNLNAQYRCVPHIDEYGNPSKDLNNDLISTGVTYAMSQQLNPVWSAVYPIGFPFVFNGDSVTHFKVSSTGVVTFDTAATTAPPFGAVMLPNAQIPDKSICITGIKACNSNSKVVLVSEPLYYLTSGTKRKWIMFNQFSDTTGSGYLYTVSWSIVLEEITNKIYIVDAYTNPYSSVVVSAGIQINNSTAYVVPGSPQVPSRSGNGLYDTDNVYYEFTPGNDLQTDGALTNSSLYAYQDLSEAPVTIPVKFRNLGSDTVNTLSLSYAVNGVLQQTQTFNGLSIPCGNSQVFNFSNQWTPADTGNFTIQMEAVNVNNNTDADLSNNQWQVQVNVAPVLPPRRVLFEQIKGTWCLHCGYWTVKYDSILALNRAKASDLKIEDGGYNLAWSQNDVNRRIRFYNNISFPSAYGNGKLALSNVYNNWEGCPWHVDQNMVDSLYGLNGLFYIQPTFTTNGYHGEITATVTSAAQFMPGSHCRIQVAILQDTIVTPPQGNSNESQFVNTMLRMFPDAQGTYIGSPTLGQVDSLQFSFQITDTSTIIPRLRLVVFVQDSVTKEVFQVAEVPVVNSCPPVYTASVHHICLGDSIQLNGTWYSGYVHVPQMYTGSNGCDSLHLDVVKPITASVLASAYLNQINSSVYFYGGPDSVLSYAWYDATYNQFIPGAVGPQYTPVHPGMYVLVVTTHMGCVYYSSTVNFQCSPSSFQQSFTICNGDSIHIGTMWVSLAGIYKDTLINATGCDSIITTTLVVNSPDTGVVVNNNVFVANSGNNYYEWIDCLSGNVLSSGANDTLFTATVTGWYQLQVTDANGCTFGSACYPVYFTGLSDTDDPGFMVMPNPASDFIQLIITQPLRDGIVRVYDAKGTLALEAPIQHSSMRIETSSLPNGVYSLTLSGNGVSGRYMKLVIAH